jgi:hypothetical protein
MARKKRSEPEPVFKAVPFVLGTTARKSLTDDYLPVDDQNLARLAKLFDVEHTIQAIQTEAIARIERAVGEYLGAVNSGNGSLSRGRQGRPERSAYRRMHHALRNMFWIFNPEDAEDKSKTIGSVHQNSERTSSCFEFVRIITHDAGIAMPKRRAGRNDDLQYWVNPTPRDRIGERTRLMHDANDLASGRKERTEWEMPPPVHRIKREEKRGDETVEIIEAVDGDGQITRHEVRREDGTIE